MWVWEDVVTSDKAQTWIFSEEYVSESETIQRARDVAIELGAEPISTGVGATLRMLASCTGAKAVLEIGTGAGVSGLWMLEGIPTNGVLTTIDVEPEFHRHARRAFESAGRGSGHTRLISGRALDVLPRMAAGAYDMIVIDADVKETPEYLDHALRILRPGGTAVVVHALWHDRVADPARRDEETVVMREVIRVMGETEDFVTSLLPVGDGVLVAVKA